MNDELVANIVSFEEDDAVAVLAFCAEEGQSSQYLMLQFPSQTDEQDRRFRLDGLYIERDDQAFGCHHGVESIRRNGDRIEIDLNTESKATAKNGANSHCSRALESGNRPRTCPLCRIVTRRIWCPVPMRIRPSAAS